MNEIVYRKWGHYVVLAEGINWKLKRLIVNPRTKSTYQKHFKRSETWFYPDSGVDTFIPVGEWHQLVNDTDKPLEIIELQHGETCVETDIQRKDYL